VLTGAADAASDILAGSGAEAAGETVGELAEAAGSVAEGVGCASEGCGGCLAVIVLVLLTGAVLACVF
jgi:hypothetical protein